MMMKKGSGRYLFVTAFLLSLIMGLNPDLQAADKLIFPDLSPEKVADYMHSIIEADRKIYTTYVVKRMQEQGIVLAREDWESKNGIPLPAQFLH